MSNSSGKKKNNKEAIGYLLRECPCMETDIISVYEYSVHISLRSNNRGLAEIDALGLDGTSITCPNCKQRTYKVKFIRYL
jgi:hypothetical protein